MTHHLPRLFLPLLIFGITSLSFGGEVTKVSKKKKSVYINLGSKDGLKKGEKVCFFKQDDEEKKVGCGKVRKVKKSKAIIKVKKKIVKKVKKGFLAKHEGAGAKKEDVASKKSKALVLRGFYDLAFMTPFTFNNITYQDPTKATTGGGNALTEEEAGAGDAAAATATQWTSEAEGLSPTQVSSNYLGFGGEFEHESWGIVLGGRFHIIDPLPVNDGTVDLNTTTPSNFGVYFDYVAFEIFGIKLGAGLDLDITGLTYQAQDAEGNSQAVYEDSLTTISIRAPVRYALVLGSFELFGAFNLLIPVAGEASGTPELDATTLASEERKKLIPDPEADFKTALGFQRNSVAISLGLGIGYRI